MGVVGQRRAVVARSTTQHLPFTLLIDREGKVRAWSREPVPAARLIQNPGAQP
jgi:hypothetical protein